MYLVVYRNWMLLRDRPEVLENPDLREVPARVLDGWRRSARYAALDPATQDLRLRQFAKLQELTRQLHQAGVELLAGTDTPVQFCPPGASMHQELELLVAAGLSPAAALTAATVNNARTLDQTGKLGTLEAGTAADLVILEADPLADIRNTRKILQVVHAGIVTDPATLRRLVPE